MSKYEHLADPEHQGESLTLANMRKRLVRGLALSNLPRLQWLADGIVPTPSLVALYGPPKAGKSFVAIDLALSVATGRKWLGHEVKQGPVLYIVAEGQAGVIVRQESWSEYHGTTDHDVYWHPGSVNLFSLEQSSALAELAAELHPALVVVDTLARCSAGADEISTKDMGQIVEAADRIRDASGATVLIVHHSGKDASKGLRGSTALYGAVDAVLKVTGSEGRVRLEVEDAKDFASGYTVNLGMEQVGESLVLVEGVGSTSTVVSAKAGEALIALGECAPPEGLSASAWREVADLPESTFYRARKLLIDRGQVTNIGTPKMPRYIVGVAAS